MSSVTNKSRLTLLRIKSIFEAKIIKITYIGYFLNLPQLHFSETEMSRVFWLKVDKILFVEIFSSVSWSDMFGGFEKFDKWGRIFYPH